MLRKLFGVYAAIIMSEGFNLRKSFGVALREGFAKFCHVWLDAHPFGPLTRYGSGGRDLFYAIDASAGAGHFDLMRMRPKNISQQASPPQCPRALSSPKILRDDKVCEISPLA